MNIKELKSILKSINKVYLFKSYIHDTRTKSTTYIHIKL